MLPCGANCRPPLLLSVVDWEARSFGFVLCLQAFLAA